jgi:hypothetical protein
MSSSYAIDVTCAKVAVKYLCLTRKVLSFVRSYCAVMVFQLCFGLYGGNTEAAKISEIKKKKVQHCQDRQNEE